MNISKTGFLVFCAALAAAFLICVNSSPFDTAETFAYAPYGAVPVIDAGHGGADGGASSLDGMTESEINLDIALRLENLLAFSGYAPVMTRREEAIAYPDGTDTIKAKKVYDQKARLALINETPNAVLISIHQNKYSSSKPFGAQSFYNPREGAQELASAVQQNIKLFDSENSRSEAAISGDIFLMREAAGPGVLIECAFLSNERDCALLRTETYRTEIALAAAAAFLNLY